MISVARVACKVLYFIVLFITSVALLHLPYPISKETTDILFRVSNGLGIVNPEDFYFPFILTVDFVAALIMYKATIFISSRLIKKPA